MVIDQPHFNISQIALHVSYLHSLINPVLFMIFDDKIRSEVQCLCFLMTKKYFHDVEMIPTPPRPPSLLKINEAGCIPPPAEFSTTNDVLLSKKSQKVTKK